MSPVVLPSLASPTDEVWETLFDLSEQLSVPWTLVGGQMVLLHALEHGASPPAISRDGDVVADIRAAPGSPGKVVAVLEGLDFTLDGASPDGIAQRYHRPSQSSVQPVRIDLLAPEGVGENASLRTTPPGRTVMVPGGTQALRRREIIEVLHGQRLGRVPRPSLHGAVILKAAACGLPGDPTRHLRDLAFLVALVAEPYELAEALTPKDRKRLKLAAALDETDHPAWQLLPDDLQGEGLAAWEILRSVALH